jgi:hypothetical protein
MVHAVGNDNDATLEPRRVFTAGGATKMLPLVRRIVSDLVRLNRSVLNQREQLSGVDCVEQPSEHASYQDELTDMRHSLQDAETDLAACEAELSALGVSVHHPIDGSVDFPAVINRRPVQLCWRPGEETVCHWHESDSDAERGSAKRHRIQQPDHGTESLN